ncbi:hypothetical protein EJ480_04125, partial [Acinetobacter baumannii]
LKRWLLHKYLKIRTTLPFVYLCNKAFSIYCYFNLRKFHFDLLIMGNLFITYKNSLFGSS